MVADGSHLFEDCLVVHCADFGIPIKHFTILGAKGGYEDKRPIKTKIVQSMKKKKLQIESNFSRSITSPFVPVRLGADCRGVRVLINWVSPNTHNMRM